MRRSFSLSEREANIAITVGRPDKVRLRVRKLADYTLGLYAARTYLDQHEPPETLAGLKVRTLVGYDDDPIYTTELNYTAEFLRDWLSDLSTSTAIGQIVAVRAGVGIGIFLDFLAAACPDLVRLFPDQSVSLTYRVVWHENLRVARRLKAVVELLDRMARDEHFGANITYLFP